MLASGFALAHRTARIAVKSAGERPSGKNLKCEGPRHDGELLMDLAPSPVLLNPRASASQHDAGVHGDGYAGECSYLTNGARRGSPTGCGAAICPRADNDMPIAGDELERPQWKLHLDANIREID